MPAQSQPLRHVVIDETHDTAARSFVSSANGHRDFPLQNLPFGMYSSNGGAPRAGVAIGDSVLDLAGCVEQGLLSGSALEAAKAACGGTLNGLLALQAEARRVLRHGLFSLLRQGSPHEGKVQKLLTPQSKCQMHLPARIGDFTDFYAGIQHATNAGSLFRPDNPLLPNYKYVPVGYHGRSSSVRVSGTSVKRPSGQLPPAAGSAPPVGPSRKLDFELEMGIWIGEGNELGHPIPIAEASTHIAGFCLLNDWSARDMQAWEYQPLGPFLAKNFSTTISPWIVTTEALAPYFAPQKPRPPSDPAPLPYLSDAFDQQHGALNVQLEAFVLTESMRQKGLEPYRCTRVSARELYWTFAQLVTHHTVAGCNLNAGDLLGTGTISGAQPDEVGSLLEATFNGKKPINLASGETRTFIEDGDEIIFKARAERDGFVSLGFGECRARITPHNG